LRSEHSLTPRRLESLGVKVKGGPFRRESQEKADEIRANLGREQGRMERDMQKNREDRFPNKIYRQKEAIWAITFLIEGGKRMIKTCTSV